MAGTAVQELASAAAEPAPRAGRRAKRRGLRFWWLPLALAVVLPFVLWLGLNGAFVLFARQDLGTAVAPAAAAAPNPAQAAAIQAVQGARCLPGNGTIGGQAAFAGAHWSAVASAVEPAVYYVAAADLATERLLGVWQAGDGQVARLETAQCPGIPAGDAARRSEALVLLSPHHATP